MNIKQLKEILEKHKSLGFPDTESDIGSEIKPDLALLDGDIYGDAFSLAAGKKDEISNLENYRTEIEQLKKVSEESNLPEFIAYLDSLEGILKTCADLDNSEESNPWWKIW